MALIKCTECGKEISDSAENCPHCGCKTSHGKTVTQGKGILINCVLLFGFFLVGFILLISSFAEISEYSSSFWRNGRWVDDSDAIKSIFKLMIGIGLLIGAGIDGFLVYRKSQGLQSKPFQTIAAPQEIPSHDTAYIPPEKRCHGVCEKCQKTGIAAICIIPDTGYEHKLCPSCIRRYSARIK